MRSWRALVQLATRSAQNTQNMHRIHRKLRHSGRHLSTHRFTIEHTKVAQRVRRGEVQRDQSGSVHKRCTFCELVAQNVLPRIAQSALDLSIISQIHCKLAFFCLD
jgi:hypothetical protein